MSSAAPSCRSHRWPVTPIKVARVAAGLLQSDVAAAAGSTTTRISLLERGLVQATPQEAEHLSAVIERIAQEQRP
jgi:transcriptional regulator with XRE-family HTH domain